MALVVMLPTALMGANLPLLAGYLVRANANVGRTVAAVLTPGVVITDGNMPAGRHPSVE